MGPNALPVSAAPSYSANIPPIVHVKSSATDRNLEGTISKSICVGVHWCAHLMDVHWYAHWLWRTLVCSLDECALVDGFAFSGVLDFAVV